MNILYITPYYKPSWFYGGPPKCIAEQAEYLVKHFNMHIEAVTLNINGTQLLYDTSKPVIKDVNGVKVHYLPASKGKLGKAYFNSGYLNSYFDQFNNYDSFHIHTLFNAFSRKGMQHAWTKKIPFVLTPHGMLDKFSLSRSGWLKKIHRYAYDDKLMAVAKAVQFTTDNELKSSLVKPGISSVVIPLGFEFNDFMPPEKTIKENKLRLIFLGRINRKKGIDLLLKGMALVDSSIRQNIYLDIYGSDDDDCKKELEDFIKKNNLTKNVCFCGNLDPAQRDAKLNEYDCLALTSHQENFGLVVTEALSTGLPVFISDKVNLCDFVTENNCGWVSSLQVADITKTLTQIYNTEKEERIKKGMNGYDAVRKNFSMADVAGQYADMYQKISGHVSL